MGIVRVSGPLSQTVAQKLLSSVPVPKKVHVGSFYDTNHDVIDHGLALFFKAPHSFTGEDVLELHAHGNPTVLDLLLKEVHRYGVRDAQNGEFSKRAFLNNKLDLTQAEAIADLITADNHASVRACARSLQGTFSKHISTLNEALTDLHALAEAFIDFPEEASETPSAQEHRHLSEGLVSCREQIQTIHDCAHRGYKLQNTMHVALLGAPNCGKSTLLNTLAERQSAIVSDIPGTTRDVIRESIQIDGIQFCLSDTAGLRDDKTIDDVEKEGMRRAKHAAQQADHVLWMYDSSQYTTPPPLLIEHPSCTIVANKCDLTNTPPAMIESQQHPYHIRLSAQDSQSVELLRKHLGSLFQGQNNTNQLVDVFSARRRHLRLLQLCSGHLKRAQEMHQSGFSAELVAEELRLARHNLGDITGTGTHENILDKIFNRFCIGK